MNLVSIIIPMYNAEKYIARCLDSISNQDYKNLEILCIIDGSTDHSEQICTAYKEKDDRISVVSIKKSGVGKARNIGLSKIKGDWFMYVDADDWIEPNYITTLLKNAVEYDCSISACGYRMDSTFVFEKSEENQFLLLKSPEECIHNFICPGWSMQGMVWNKLYRSDIYRDVLFREDIPIYEDCLYTYEIMKRCSGACLSDAVLYHWFQHKDSACHSKRKCADFSPADVFMYLINQTNRLKDTVVKTTLLYSYIQELVTVLLDTEYEENNFEIQTRRADCRKYRKVVWKKYNFKQKCRFLIAVYFPFLRKLFW